MSIIFWNPYRGIQNSLKGGHLQETDKYVSLIMSTSLQRHNNAMSKMGFKKSVIGNRNVDPSSVVKNKTKQQKMIKSNCLPRNLY